MTNEARISDAATKSREAKVAFFMMGGPGAGKSYTMSRVFSGHEVKLLDADSIKAEHPDYDPKAPEKLHSWSAIELKARVADTIANGESFIYDGTGSNSDKYVSMIRDAQAAGYDTHIIYVACSLATALTRNANRERVVPEEVVRDKHSTIATSFEIVSRYADNVHVIENN